MPRRTATVSQPDSTEELEKVTSEHSEAGEGNMLDLDDLKDLIFLGKLSQKVKVGNFSFEISTLTTSQQKEVMSSIMSDNSNATQRMLEIKPLTLSYAVTSVNGVPLENLCKAESKKDVAEKRLHVMMSLQSVLLEKLYKEFDELVTRSNKQLGIEDLKE